MWYLFIGLIVGLVIGAVVMYLYIPKAAKKKIDNFLTGLMSSNETIGEFLSRILTNPEAKRFVNKLKKDLSEQIYLRISECSVSDGAAHLLVEQVCTRLTLDQVGSELPQGFFGRGKDMLKNIIKDYIESVVRKNECLIEQTLSSKINDIITQNGETLVANIVNQEIDHILSRPVSSMFQGNEETINKLKQQFSTVLMGKK